MSMEVINSPATPRWNSERPFLTGRFHQETKTTSRFADTKGYSVDSHTLQTAKSIDEVIQHHDFFLDKCLRGCLLLLPEFLKKVERLKSLCLQYASATQWLISSLLSAKPRQSKSRSPCQALTISSSNTNFTDAILKFEREFDAELQSLAPILSSSSQAEPYLTHLAQWILGIGNDQ